MGLRGPNVDKLLRKRDVQGLIKALDHPDVPLRVAVLGALGDIADPSSLEPIATALQDPKPGVQSAAVDAIGRFRDVRATELLARILSDGRSFGIERAAIALANISTPESVGILVRCLGSENNHVVQASAKALAELRDPAVLDGAVDALPDTLLSTGLLRAVVGLRHPSADHLMARTVAQAGLMVGDRAKEMSGIVRAAEPEFVVGLLTSSDPSVRRRVAECVRGPKPSRWSAQKDRSWPLTAGPMQTAILEALPVMEEQADIDVLVPLAESSPDIRRQLVPVFARRRAAKAAAVVATQLSARDPGWQSEAGEAFRQLADERDPAVVDHETVEALTKALREPHSQESTAMLLADIGDAVSVQALVAAARDADKQRDAPRLAAMTSAIKSIRKPRALPAFVTSELTWLREAAGEALKAVAPRGDPRVMLSDPDSGRRLTGLLRVTRDPNLPLEEHARVVVERESDENLDVRNAAAFLAAEVARYGVSGELAISQARGGTDEMLALARNYVVRTGPGDEERNKATSAMRYLMERGIWDRPLIEELTQVTRKIRGYVESDTGEHGGFTQWQYYENWLPAAEAFLAAAPRHLKPDS